MKYVLCIFLGLALFCSGAFFGYASYPYYNGTHVSNTAQIETTTSKSKTTSTNPPRKINGSENTTISTNDFDSDFDGFLFLHAGQILSFIGAIMGFAFVFLYLI